MFRWLFKRQAPEVAPKEAKRLGFFSTDAMPSHESVDIERILLKSIQKTSEQFKLVDENGKAIAMDDIGGGFPSVKYSGDAQGAGIPWEQVAWYSAQGFIGYQVMAIIAQNWLVDKACSMPAKDAVRHGYEVTVNDGTEVKPEVIDEIRRQDKKFRLKEHCREFIRKGRMFGIRHAIFKVQSNDPFYYEKPFNPDGITPGSYKGIVQVDPYWITPELDFQSAADPTSLHYYEPTWWRIGGKRYHRSHLIIFKNGEVPDILKPTYMYGGVSVPQKIAERVYASERTANEAPMLAMSKRMTVLNVDVAQAIADSEGFADKMAKWMGWVSNYGVKIIGGEEKIEQYDTSLADLDNVIMSQFQLVSAASGVPVTKLLGTTPKGFNSTGEYDEKSYHEELESMQEHDLSPLVNRHHMLLVRSEIAPKLKTKPFETEVNWKPTDSPSASEIADINFKKSQTDSNYVNVGALNGVDVRDRLIADPDSGYNGIEAIEQGDIVDINEDGDEEDPDAA